MSLHSIQTGLYRTLAVAVLLVLALAVLSHFARVQALIGGASDGAQTPWVEVCTPNGIERVALEDGR